MGSLNLPTSGLIYVDAQIVIYSVEKRPQFAPALRPLWQAVQTGRLTVVTSELTILEMLVHPKRYQDQDLIDRFERFIVQPQFECIAISRDILRAGADLRATNNSLRTPDAVHVATAISQKCDLLLTNDISLRKLNEIPVSILNDCLQ